MEFSGVTNDASLHVAKSIDDVLVLSISPADKERIIAEIVLSVGQRFYSQMYDAASQVFGSEALKSAGLNDVDGQAGRLALKIVRNYALARNTVESIITSYYNSILAQSQSEAFVNAKSMQKHPTLTRTVVGETCKWCDSKAGTHVDPTGEDFARHKECDCRFVVNGFNSRNGTLNNYVKSGAKQ